MFLFDTHLHLDLFSDYRKIIEEIEKKSIPTIAVTNAPSVFNKSHKIASDCSYINTALGFHPELIKERYHEIELFADLIKKTNYIGEIGLDYSRANNAEKKIQSKAFEKILKLCADNGPKTLSIHSRMAIDHVMELVGRNFNGNVIFHWFLGSLSLLSKAIDSGYFFSINYAMVTSGRGSDIVKRIPLNKLLLESDGPFVKINGKPATPLCTKLVLEKIAEIKSMDVASVENCLHKNFSQINL